MSQQHDDLFASLKIKPKRGGNKLRRSTQVKRGDGAALPRKSKFAQPMLSPSAIRTAPHVTKNWIR